MPSDDTVLIFDLDGTILSVNSFPQWVKYLLSGPFPDLTMAELLALRLATFRALLGRKLLRVPHADTKLRLQSLWQGALGKDPQRRALDYFCTKLERHIRPNMHAVLSAVRSGRFDAVLATSAAETYAEAFGKRLGFTHILASGSVENRAEEKCDRTLMLLSQMHWEARRRIFFTDHVEDLPLIRQCQRIIWLGNAEDAARLKAETSADIIQAEGLPEIKTSDHF